MRVVIATCTRNEWLVPKTIKYWRRAWPECAWPVESVSGDRAWSDQMLDWLVGKHEPFLLMLEDYITVKVDRVAMKAARVAMMFDDVGTVRLMPLPTPPQRIEHATTPRRQIGEHGNKKPYAVSLQAAFWRPEMLRDLLKRGENPWETELKGTQRAKVYTKYRFLGTFAWAITYKNALRRGKIHRPTQFWMRLHP